jgi:hypothetical protein
MHPSPSFLTGHTSWCPRFLPGFAALALLWPGHGFIGGALGQDTQVTVERTRRILSDAITLPAFAPESSADRDIGIQEVMTPIDEYDPFTLSFFSGYYFTDNANLSEINPQQDNVFWTQAEFTYLPVIKDNLYGELSVGETWYLYNQYPELDFNNFDGNAGLVYVIRQLGDTSTFVRYHYEYIDNYHQTSDPITTIDSPYQNHSIQLGFYKPWTLSRHHFLYLSYLSEFSLDGKPDYAVRNEHRLIAGYRIHPLRKVTGDLYYQQAFLDFEDNGRDDWNASFGASLSYHITRNIYLAATASYNDNDSNVSNADYQVWMTGIHLGGIFQF